MTTSACSSTSVLSTLAAASVCGVPDHPQQAILQVGYVDSIYLHSKGGRTFSGWSCEHLPYLVEFDNWGVSKYPGQPRQTAGRQVRGAFWIWGYDEISWFANQSRAYRAQWLRYAWNWVRTTDPNGFLEMPGSRTVTSPLNHRRWYFANNPSAAVPDGVGDEDVIRSIWRSDYERTSVSVRLSPYGHKRVRGRRSVCERCD